MVPMIITLKHTQNDKEFVLLDTSHEAVISVTGGLLTGVRTLRESESKVCVCDRSGKISWLEVDEVKVIAIDGKLLNELLYQK